MFGLQQTILIMLWLPQPIEDTSLIWSSGQSSYAGCSLPKEGKCSPLFLMADQGKIWSKAAHQVPVKNVIC